MLTRSAEIEKIYYSIGEVAAMFDVNASLIRFWEKEFPQLQPRKNSRGNRVYTKKEIELFARIHELVKERGYTLEGAKNALREKVDLPQEEIIGRLLKIKSELTSIASMIS
jgi:DNA-binding transcriptional MerR regulator